jgi:peptidoglycan/LPS O-acetylase OafA/YrhL
MDYINSTLQPAGSALTGNAEVRTRVPALSIRAPACQQQYLPALTGLRFALALWVILHHLTGKNMLLEHWTHTLPLSVQSILRGGYLAVQSFFLLSGFVLAQSYAATRWNRQSLKRFAVARFARIYPVYLLSLILISWFAFEFVLKPGRTIGQKAVVLGDYALLLQGWNGSLSVGWNTPAWSLSCEFFFYLCFPLLFPWLRRGQMPRTLLALGGSLVTPILLAHAGVPTNWKPIHHLSDFLAGIAAAGIYNAIARSGFAPKWLGAAIYLPALTAGAAFIVYPHVLDGTPMNLNTVLRPLNVALLIGLALGGGILGRALASDTAGYLGKASYSMYILHIPLLWWFSRYTFYRYGTAPPAWTGLLFIALVIAASMAAFEFVETRSNQWIREWAAARIESPGRSVLRAAA